MRIVAGVFKGRRLAAPRGRDVRPTSDRVREALFQMLGPLDGAEVLDLFAGTGALGLEALSRGAESATFVELDRQALQVVQRNIDATITSDAVHTNVIKGDGPRVVRSLALAGERFDLVFLDPPYEQTAEIFKDMAHSIPSVTKAGSRVVIELATRHRNLIAEAAANWNAHIGAEKTYGDTTVAILDLVEVPSDDDLKIEVQGE